MTCYRILHVDDDPDFREVVKISLGLDAQLDLQSYICGEDCLAEAEASLPDLILSDVMMPVMSGIAMLERLRGSTRTTAVPLVFLTALAQSREISHFMALGADGVITKPIDPMTLAGTVRRHLQTAKLAVVNDNFRSRMRLDAATLSECREMLPSDATSANALERIQSCAHKLAGAAGIFGFKEVSAAALALEMSTTDRRCGRDPHNRMEADLDILLDSLEDA